MGSWFIGWTVALLVVLIGLYTHVSLVILGALIPAFPLVAELLRRRRARRQSPRPPDG